MTDDVEYPSMCLVAICIFFEELSIQILCTVSITLLIFVVLRVLYIFSILDLYQIHDLQIFPPIL